ncbi:cyclic nucleotide-binding domain-containing protein [candidate division GN15 bacterium]|nr:cyclic nucleotide-binding domain-containing protein [candidate division GN15 bacterium]
MTIMEKVLALHDVDLFGLMDTEELSILATIAEEDQFDSHDELFRKDDPAESLYLVLSGEVRVVRDNQEIFVAGPTDALGTLSILDAEPWLFSAIATEPTKVLRIDRETFLDVIADHQKITEAILRSLVKKVRNLVNSPLARVPRREEGET